MTHSDSKKIPSSETLDELTSPVVATAAVDDDPPAGNQRVFIGPRHYLFATACAAYAVFHLAVMNLYPLETWTYRLLHLGGGLALGFLLYGAYGVVPEQAAARRSVGNTLLLALAAAGTLFGAGAILAVWANWWFLGNAVPPGWAVASFGIPLTLGTTAAVLHGWLFEDRRIGTWTLADILLAVATAASIGYVIYFARALQMRAGMPMAQPGDMWAAITGVILILEAVRRMAGMALVIISAVFVAYAFAGPWLPGILNHGGYEPKRFFSYIFTDNGILSAPIAISSTYIVLFVIFAAFLQATHVGAYFVNVAFAAAGHKRGGPAKVAVFASGLMGMINGTSAGNVVSTGSLTIPLMKKVGYRSQTSAAVEAAASSGGQIMPPIMGAGAFIMAEITGIPYTEIIWAALIPAILYFASVFFMVDLMAQRFAMVGLPRSALPKLGALLKQAYLFAPIVVLIWALFVGYSVIRCGTLAMITAAVVSWLTPNRMGPRQLFHALDIGARMVLQLVAVCAAAGIIVGVIALTGIGTRFSALLLGIADQSQLLAMMFSMLVAIILGMGMPTTAAYAVAASVIAPGLINLGVEPLTAHFFIFYFAVMSAITPPVALAAYAGAALAQSDPMKTSVESFRIGLAAFVVPYMFFFSDALLMQGGWLDTIHVTISALFGIYLLSSGIIGWFFGRIGWIARALLIGGALGMLDAGLVTDLVGLSIGTVLLLYQKNILKPGTLAHGKD
ncbi:TRAP transporter fused permease subunit [Limimaricola sp. G21655-S1]|uniref:TRAP transporter permease n=1 Tax=Limimaricola sp. G21655-S1 TaxID=3014768 RepID=UPI0022AE9268|nr:TRAP transporter fused permease subunit [Limimaricola sp. G21655-S1]MCZ4262700.1 TRAP transporter fused permease subunit [Limimaricola sp. G21655-S1]